MNVRSRRLQSLIALSVVLGIVGCGSSSDVASVGPDGRAPADHSDQANTANSAIAQRPLAGVVRGADFEYEKATIENGILTVRSGDDFFADLSLTLFLFLEEGEVPSGKSFHVKRDSISMKPVHIHSARVMKEGEAPEIEMAMDDFELSVEFGTAVDKKLPGVLRLEMADKFKTKVEGSFVADVEGFILVDGMPDRTSDSIALLRWIAREQIEQTYPSQSVEFLEQTEFSYVHAGADGKQQHGSADIEFSVDGGESEIWRLQFLKEDEGWVIGKRFSTRELIAAHPPQEPLDTDEYHRFGFLMAKHVEAELVSHEAGPGVYGVATRSSWNSGVGMGEGTIRYRLGRDSESVERRFLFRQKDSIWRIDRELGENEVVNYREMSNLPATG
jgi:hypothetical protein